MPLFRKENKDLSDEKLMALVAQSNSSAFEEIYDRYSKVLVNYFYRMLWKDREKAQDMMHDFFTKIVNKPELYDPNKRAFSTWMFSVANNMCKNEYRRAEVRKGTVGGLNEEMAVSNEDHNHALRRLDHQRFDARLYQELDKLNDEQRSTFVLRFKEEKSIKEIAEISNCSEGTVKSRIFYTLKKLSEGLKEFDPALSQKE